MIEFSATLKRCTRKPPSERNPGIFYEALVVFADPDAARNLMSIDSQVVIQIDQYQPSLSFSTEPMGESPLERLINEQPDEPDNDQLALNGSNHDDDVNEILDQVPLLGPRRGRRRGTVAVDAHEGP